MRSLRRLLRRLLFTTPTSTSTFTPALTLALTLTLPLHLTACATHCTVGAADDDELLSPPCLTAAAAAPAGATPLTITPITSTSSFVTRDKSHLLLDGNPFRIVGTNVYWLGLDEWSGVKPPTEYRQQDVLLTAWQLGANVVRSHSLGISTGNANSLEPALGEFHDDAFAAGDRAIQLAGQLGIRLIIPLTDNYHYYHGGRFDFTHWRGLGDTFHGDAFFTNANVINDFQNYVEHILTHVNTLTGVAYKDDPTILVWELGNELAPDEGQSLLIPWGAQISHFIRELDPNHLIADAWAKETRLSASLIIPDIDLYTTHFYNCTADPNDILKAAAPVIEADKAFYIGEFDWTQDTPMQLQRALDLVNANPDIAGDLYWSLWGHADAYGYAGGDIFSLHAPGDDGGRQQRVIALREHALAMRGLPLTTWSAPPAPKIVDVERAAGGIVVAWRGSAAAAAYTIETGPQGFGPWTTACDACATDLTVPWTLAALDAYVRVTPVACDGTVGAPSDSIAVPAPPTVSP